MLTVKEVVAKEFQERNVEVDPLYPRVLVRVLPKEQTSRGGIVLTDHEQNKPVHEGIVLRVYRPFWQKIRRKMADWEIESSPDVYIGPDREVEKIWKECAVQPGDHVLFPHMAFGITPVWPLDDGKGDFRLVEEGQILGRLDYQQESPEEWIAKLLDDFAESTIANDLEEIWAEENGITDGHLLAQKILQNADVIRKREAKTLSGR